VEVPRYNDIIPFVDRLNYLENSHIIRGLIDLSCPITGTSIAAGSTAVSAEIAEILKAPTFPHERLEALGLRNKIPFWNARFYFYGPPNLITAQWQAVKDAFADIDGVNYVDGEVQRFPLSKAQSDAIFDPVILGIPTLKTFSLAPLANAEGVAVFKGAQVTGHVFFSPIVPRTGEAIIEVNAVLGEAARRFDLPQPAIQLPGTMFERAFVFVVAVPVTRDPKLNAEARGIFRSLVKLGAEHGWGEYRTAPAFYDDIMDAYSFNNHALRRFCETLKDAVDPNGILSAGRYGIWPRHLRNKR
jgi:4-cresol dehydrogenase (hydroxylating)